MKQISFLLLTAFFYLSLSNCKKLGELCFDFAQSTTISTNPVSAPGTITVTKTLSNTLSSQLPAGTSISNVNSVKVNQITITIPSNAGYTFADVTSAEVTVNGQSVGKLPTGSTGTTATFAAPTQGDVTTILKSGTDMTFVFTATFTKAVPAASTLDVKIPFNTCYQVL